MASLPLLYLITQVNCMFISDVEFDAYAPSHVQTRSKHISVIYHIAFPEDWNKSTIEENVYATDPTQQKDDDAFFDKDLLADPNEQVHIIWKCLGKFGDS